LRWTRRGNWLRPVNSPAPREGQLSKHRLEGLSDGVFAVVLTLLVLDLKLDHLPPHADNAAIWRELAGLKHPLIGFAFTFLFAGMFWVLQHRKFLLLTHTTTRHAWLTLLFLFWVTLLPFSVSTWVRTVEVSAGLTIYFANMALIAISLLAGWLDARHSGLVAPEQEGAGTRLTYRILAMTLGFIAATVISCVMPQFAAVALLVIVVAIRLAVRKFSPAPA
jgi:uncharacterized membrane protein